MNQQMILQMLDTDGIRKGKSGESFQQNQRGSPPLAVSGKTFVTSFAIQMLVPDLPCYPDDSVNPSYLICYCDAIT